MLRSFTTFSRAEQTGVLGLSVLLILLIALRATMSLWVTPADSDKQQKITAAWDAFKRSQPAALNDTVKQSSGFQDAFDDNPDPLPAIIDLNLADSATLVRLKGIGPVTAGKIIARRKNKGPFTNISQLSEVGSFSSETLSILKNHLIINK